MAAGMKDFLYLFVWTRVDYMSAHEWRVLEEMVKTADSDRMDNVYFNTSGLWSQSECSAQHTKLKKRVNFWFDKSATTDWRNPKKFGTSRSSQREKFICWIFAHCSRSERCTQNRSCFYLAAVHMKSLQRMVFWGTGGWRKGQNKNKNCSNTVR